MSSKIFNLGLSLVAASGVFVCAADAYAGSRDIGSKDMTCDLSEPRSTITTCNNAVAFYKGVIAQNKASDHIWRTPEDKDRFNKLQLLEEQRLQDVYLVIVELRRRPHGSPTKPQRRLGYVWPGASPPAMNLSSAIWDGAMAEGQESYSTSFATIFNIKGNAGYALVGYAGVAEAGYFCIAQVQLGGEHLGRVGAQGWRWQGRSGFAFGKA